MKNISNYRLNGFIPSIESKIFIEKEKNVITQEDSIKSNYLQFSEKEEGFKSVASTQKVFIYNGIEDSELMYNKSY